MGISMQVRQYEPRDREEVRRIAVETALVGRSAQSFIDGDEILADALMLYFTDYEPESCFVAELDGRVVGYIVGALDAHRMDGVVRSRVFWALLKKALGTGFFLSSKNLRLLWRLAVSLCRGEFTLPVFSTKYPAVLHINFLKKGRGFGGGAALISAFLFYLKERGVCGVRLATMSREAGRFFIHQGFSLLYEGRRTYLNHATGQDLPLLIFGLEHPFARSFNIQSEQLGEH